jgi:exonuclease SbcC
MKPRRLEIEGLRSYRKKQVIEFEPEGLLVITGSTGAGKSSLLEAMMFALYGVYSGNSKSNKELIADRSDEMRVTLDFEVNGKVYTAHRAVGRKGSGSFALTRGSNLLCHDGNRMTAEVTALIGLDEEQFKKTVFLPQGAFQNFLTSRPKERVELLKRLLQVEPLDRLEERVQQWLTQVRQVLDRAEGSRSRYPGDPAGRLQQVEAARVQAEQGEQQQQLHFQALDLLRQQLQQAQSLIEQLQQRQQQLAHFDRLRDFDEAAMARLQEQLHEQLRVSQAGLQEQLQAQQRWTEQTPPWSASDLQQATRQLQQVQHLQQDQQRLGQEQAQLQQEQVSLAERADLLQQGQLQAQQSLQQIQPRLEGHRQLWQQLGQRLQEQQRLQQEREKLQQQLRQHQDQLQQLQQHLHEAQQQLEQARQRWHEGELFRICQHHLPGQPCPVCEQPLPAQWRAPTSPDGQTLEEAETQWREAHGAWQQREAMLSATLQQLAQLHDASAPLDPAQLQELEGQVKQLEQESTGHVRQLALLQGELQALSREQESVHKRLPLLQVQLEQSQLQAQQLQQNLEDRFGAPLSDRLRQLEEQRAAWDEEHLRLRQAVLDARQHLQELQNDYARRVEQPAQQLLFVRQQCAQALQLEGASCADLLARLDQEGTRLALELENNIRHQRDIQQHFHPDSWQSAQDQLRQAQEQASRARHEVELARRQLQEVAELDRLLAPARVQLDRLTTLSRLLGHQRAKGTKMTFPQWYMQQRQSELLSLASHHLEALSGGQFRFEEDVDDAQSFRVLDLFSGVPRAVTTLSGGETFLASLSLAVALAELVGRRGGQLQALFLDEGFGTLSAECLDRALTALEQLADQGRLIGIISHVPLIAERIEQVWWVRKSPGGSEIVKADEHMRRELLRQELASFDPRMHPLFS